MSNHYHLEVKTLDNPLWKTVHYLNNLYAGYFNYRHDHVGHLFQGRFHSIPVQRDAYLLNLSRYIHLNPVVAGLVKRPEDYEWSSYRAYLPGGEPGLVLTGLVLDTISENVATQRELYRQFVEEDIGKPPKFTEELIHKTRIFGNDSFVRALYAKQPLAFPQYRLRRDSPSGVM